jgi:hypothetical protein
MGVDERISASAARVRALVVSGAAPPALVRGAVEEVPGAARDAWLDLVLGLELIPDDGAHLPAGCVPYLPCPVDGLLRMIDLARVGPDDVFVDVGSGVGRATALTWLVTGAAAIGLEVQPHLARAQRELAARLRVSRLSVVEGDAAELAGFFLTGTVFFLYCPFSGARLAKLLDDLEPIARTRAIRVCCVDLPLPPRPWLRPLAEGRDLGVYGSTAAGP